MALGHREQYRGGLQRLEPMPRVGHDHEVTRRCLLTVVSCGQADSSVQHVDRGLARVLVFRELLACGQRDHGLTQGALVPAMDRVGATPIRSRPCELEVLTGLVPVRRGPVSRGDGDPTLGSVGRAGVGSVRTSTLDRSAAERAGMQTSSGTHPLTPPWTRPGQAPMATAPGPSTPRTCWPHHGDGGVLHGADRQDLRTGVEGGHEVVHPGVPVGHRDLADLHAAPPQLQTTASG